MSTVSYNNWNTNFIYGEELTSPNMNASSVGYLHPGVYNADMCFKIDSNKDLIFTIKKGTIIVFSHHKDSDGNMINEDSFDICTKCVVKEDADYYIYNHNTDNGFEGLKALLNSDSEIFVCAFKKIITSEEAKKDMIPYIGLLTFQTSNGNTVERLEHIFPSDSGISGTQYETEATKAYYQILGVLNKKIGVDTGKTYFSGSTTTGISSDWISDHYFTTRCLPGYTQQRTFTNSSKHCDIVFYKSGSNMNFSLSYDDIVVNNIFYKNILDWRELYKWYSNSTASDISFSPNISGSLDNNTIIPKDNGNICIDFIYATAISEQCGDYTLSNIFDSDNNSGLKLDSLSFECVFLQDNLQKIKSNELDGSNYLYSDTSKITIDKLLSFLRNKNILPRLYNYIRYNKGTVGGVSTVGTNPTPSDIIIPVAMSFRYKKDEESYIQIDPNNTLCFFDLQSGNYCINTSLFSFQMADIIPALNDDTIS